MSKKDYQAIARVLHTHKPTEDERHDMELWPAADKWDYIVAGIADVMASDNGRFSRERFVEACETGTTRGMPKVGGGRK